MPEINDDKIIDNFSPTGWEVRKVKCIHCGHEMTSVHPYKIPEIQCDECMEMFNYRIIKPKFGVKTDE